MQIETNEFTRESLREDVLPIEVRGVISNRSTNESVGILVWDVSEQGIGIWSPEPVKEGDLINLELTTPFSGQFIGSIAWVEEYSSGYRFGVKVLEGQTELFILYSKFQTARAELTAIAS